MKKIVLSFLKCLNLSPHDFRVSLIIVNQKIAGTYLLTTRAVRSNIMEDQFAAVESLCLVPHHPK